MRRLRLARATSWASARLKPTGFSTKTCLEDAIARRHASRCDPPASRSTASPLDPEQIQNIVTNLVLNAHEAIGTRGQIRVQTARQNGWAILTVTDSGCGMSEEYLRHSLFRPFRTTKKGGTGIGMFQCKMIVEAHRGKIEVESQPGKGSSFRVRLPLAE